MVFDQTAAFFVVGPGLQRKLPRFLRSEGMASIELARNGIDIAEIEGLLAALPARDDIWRGRRPRPPAR